MKKLLVTLLVFLPSLAVAHTAEQDFAMRCAAPGVIKCYSFDDPVNDFVKGKFLGPDGAGVYRAAQDTEVKASGAGSLVFTLPPPPHAGANIAGAWSAPRDTPAMGRTFGENSTVYVQYRVRFSQEMLTNTWPGNNAWKVAILHNGVLTCAPIEFTLANRGMSGITSFYSNCGSRGPLTDPVTGLQKGPYPPYLVQQGDYSCAYGSFSAATCFYLPANEWLTFYYQVTIGTWGQSNSTVKVYVQREGQTEYKQIVNVHDYKFDCNTAPCSVSPGKEQGFNNITFTPYMTGLPTTAGLPGVTSKVWYDELIVSTQPIAASGKCP